MTLQLSKLNKEGIPDLVQLFKKNPILDGHNPFKQSSVEEFYWQFFSEDYEQSVYIFAADPDKDELAGTLGALFIPMIGPDAKIYQTIKPEDALVNLKSIIKHKNRDILKEMFEKICEETKSKDIKFLWGFTKEINVFHRLGFSHCFSSKQGLFTLNIPNAYQHLASLNQSNKLKQKLQILALSVVSYSKALILGSKIRDINVKEIKLNEINYEILWSFHPNNLYSIYLDKSFLEWRIENNPSELKFSILQVTNQNNEILSYLIYSKKNKFVFFIDQFLFDPSLNNQTKKKIVNSAMGYLKKQNACIVRVMGFEHNQTNREEIKILESVGFTFINKGIPFIFKTNDESIKPDNIYLSRLNTQGTF